LDSGLPLRVFLFSDAVYIARRGHCPPEGIPNVEDLLIRLLGKGATVSVCTTCIDARPYQPSDQSRACFFHTKERSLGAGDLIPGVQMGKDGGTR
jgi:sulfur relay (sulfurtransferase) complex TusBCD TusD component (DsrE family)